MASRALFLVKKKFKRTNIKEKWIFYALNFRLLHVPPNALKVSCETSEGIAELSGMIEQRIFSVTDFKKRLLRVPVAGKELS